jgi:hypothetical protein
VAERKLVSVDHRSTVQCDSPVSAYYPGNLIPEGSGSPRDNST